MERMQNRLKFVLEFANRDLSTPEPGDVLNLRHHIESFMIWGTTLSVLAPGITESRLEAFPYLSKSKKLSDFGIEDFRNLQAECKQILGSVTLTPRIKSFVKVQKLYHIKYRWMVVNGMFSHQYIGEVQDAFIFLFSRLLSSETIDVTRLARCYCRKFFYGNKRKKYCSRECNIKRINETYYQEHKAKLNRRAIQRYRDRVLQTTGQKVRTKQKLNKKGK